MRIRKQEFIALSGVEPEALSFWLEEQWLIPDVSSDEMAFSDIDIARARFILVLQHDMGVNDAGVGVVLDLVDQLHSLRRTLKKLRPSIEG